MLFVSGFLAGGVLATFLWQVSLLVKQKKLESKINIRKDKDMITNYKNFGRIALITKGKPQEKSIGSLR